MNKLKLVLIFTLVAGFSASQAYSAGEYTIYDRQKKLMEEVNQGQKTSQLTVKEAHKLRKKLAGIARKKRSMKRKSEDKSLSIDDKIALEKDLNGVSVEIKKLMLEKRVDALKETSD